MGITLEEIDNFIEFMQNCGAPAEEFSEAAAEIVKHLPDPGVDDIALIRNNPNLNFVQKFFLIRSIKKT